VIAKTGNEGYLRPEQLWNLGRPFSFRSSQAFRQLPEKDPNLCLLIHRQLLCQTKKFYEWLLYRVRLYNMALCQRL
jgi:hypothetical protein